MFNPLKKKCYVSLTHFKQNHLKGTFFAKRHIVLREICAQQNRITLHFTLLLGIEPISALFIYSQLTEKVCREWITIGTLCVGAQNTNI